MADLPITSDEGGTPVVMTDAVTTANTLTVQSDGSTKVSLGNTAGKTNVFKDGTLVTTAVTADQVVLTYTVTTGKTLYLQYVVIAGYLTAQPGNSNPVDLGEMDLQSPAGTDIISFEQMHPKQSDVALSFGEPIPIASATVIRVVVTPVTATSVTWIANFGGYER
jgi:hypothetical protein